MAMNDRKTRVLLVEDNPGDARLIREMLAETGGDGFEIDWVSELGEGLERLGAGRVDLVLLDLGLPDSRGLDTFFTAYAHSPHVPFVLMTGLDDETLALTAVRQGAQDYLVKGATDAQALLRAIRYATERKSVERALEAERQKLFTVLNSLPAFVYLGGADYKIRFANRRFQEIFGEPGDRPCYQVMAGRSAPCEACQPLEVLQTKVPQQFEWTNPNNARTYEVHNYPFCAGDGSPLVLTLGVDITERRQAEEAIKEREELLTTIYENAPLVMMLVDGQGRIRKVNKLAEQFAGVAAADLLGRGAGEALGCLQAREDPQGCGFGPHCQDCAVRHTIMETFKTGRSHQQVEAGLPVPLEGKAQEVTFLLSSARLSGQGQPQVLVTIQDITKRKQAEEGLRESEQKLRYLATQLLTAQERERERISRDLHDDLGQSLLTLKLGLQTVGRALPQELFKIKEDLGSEISLIDEITDNVRRLARDLRPSILEDLGLSVALKHLFNNFRQHNDVEMSLEMEDIENLFSPESQLIIYRVFQEALTNIAKHAFATRVAISIKRGKPGIVFTIEDNGRGFALNGVLAGEDQARGLGLSAMEERIYMLGGFFKIWSQKGQGTRITFTIPIRR
jgi:signal transduction histidine kinase/CheY-like chemotaxis protein